MWSFMEQGPATTVLDFTSDFSMMLIWLVAIVGLSAVMILWAAIEYARTKTSQPMVQTTSVAPDQQDAA